MITTTGGTQIMPWSTAGDPGKLDVVYYQTPYYDGTSTPDNYPDTAAWTVGFAQNLNALTAGSTWARQTASPVNHYGGACESGITCTGNRDLYDDFGVAASPTTGLASIWPRSSTATTSTTRTVRTRAAATQPRTTAPAATTPQSPPKSAGPGSTPSKGRNKLRSPVGAVGSHRSHSPSSAADSPQGLAFQAQ